MDPTRPAKPFVVSVLDQDGSAFAGVVVTFSVYRWWGDALSRHGHHRCQRPRRHQTDAGQPAGNQYR